MCFFVHMFAFHIGILRIYINRITYLFGTKNSRVYDLAVKFDESSNSAIWTLDRRIFFGTHQNVQVRHKF